VFSKGYGFADTLSGDPVTTNHLFRIASPLKTYHCWMGDPIQSGERPTQLLACRRLCAYGRAFCADLRPLLFCAASELSRRAIDTQLRQIRADIDSLWWDIKKGVSAVTILNRAWLTGIPL
jgi:hypothetical protein